jgi:N-sulfoglucosamine sulfohydrolase
MNFLLITVDDLNYNSTGIFGCKTKDITPNIDKLASQGMRFEYSHVSVAVCQPSRQAMMTGRLPHNNGAPGFHPILPDVPTLQEKLNKAGYMNGIIGKENHLAPKSKFCWDYFIQTNCPEKGQGRDPKEYYKHVKEFLQLAKSEGKPFFLMANSHDPHRPFAGSQEEFEDYGKNLPIERVISPDEVEVPGFLPELPEVREEVAQYLTSAHRGDQTVGEVLRALKEEGFEDDTLVMFLSDNGMSFPFSKTNCYLNSTATPWIVRWPGKVQPNSFDREHFIRGVDYMPTILDIAGIEHDGYFDGSSFKTVLLGEKSEGREDLFKVINSTAAQLKFPMRGYQNKEYGYIYNSWSSPDVFFHNDSKFGLTYTAMIEAGKTDEKMKERVYFYDHRIKEELYDFRVDKNALNNLAYNEEYKDVLNTMRAKMRENMTKSRDPLVEDFDKYLKGKSE